MLVEIPECRRCCCFVPLRYGILVFGYINLVFSILVLSLETWLGETTNYTMSIYRGVSFYARTLLPIFLYAMETIFNIILVVGAHMKNLRLLRTYYYYGITTTLAAFVSLFVVKYHQVHYDFEQVIIELSFVFCGFAIQIYLLLLIRTELKKLRQNNQLSFINHVAEVVVTVHPDDEGRNPL
ncbi:uncharacterized protein [Battus philenor]|uniref:uncharacterized protein n=1 Tax=Battus philenor TaxID=42288 RepID=UPI0035CF4766